MFVRLRESPRCAGSEQRVPKRSVGKPGKPAESLWEKARTVRLSSRNNSKSIGIQLLNKTQPPPFRKLPSCLSDTRWGFPPLTVSSSTHPLWSFPHETQPEMYITTVLDPRKTSMDAENSTLNCFLSKPCGSTQCPCWSSAGYHWRSGFWPTGMPIKK